MSSHSSALPLMNRLCRSETQTCDAFSMCLRAFSALNTRGTMAPLMNTRGRKYVGEAHATAMKGMSKSNAWMYPPKSCAPSKNPNMRLKKSCPITSNAYLSHLSILNSNTSMVGTIPLCPFRYVDYSAFRSAFGKLVNEDLHSLIDVVFELYNIRHRVKRVHYPPSFSVLTLIKICESVWVSCPCRAERKVKVSL